MRQKILSYFVIIIVAISFNAIQAKAESSGWVHPTVLDKFSKQMSAKGMIPVKMSCKGDSASTNIRNSMLVNMEFAPNSGKKRWRWAWGSSYGKIKHNLESKGWKQVSTSSFVRPKTGLAVRCGIFHAP